MSAVPESNEEIASNVKPAIQINIDHIKIVYNENKENKKTPKKLVKNILQDVFKLQKTPEKVDMNVVEPQITIKKVLICSCTKYKSPFKSIEVSTPQKKVTRSKSLQNMQGPDLQPKPNPGQKIYCKIVEQDNTKPKTVILSKPGCSSKTVTGIIKGTSHVWTVKTVPKLHDASPKSSTSTIEPAKEWERTYLQFLQKPTPGTYQNSCLTNISTDTTNGQSSTITQSNETPATIPESGTLKRKQSLETDVQPKKYTKYSEQLNDNRIPVVVLEKIKVEQPVKIQSITGQIKRPPTAFLLFQQSIRNEFKLKHPGMKGITIRKKAAAMWRALKDKSEWETKAAQEYADAMEGEAQN